MDTIRKLALGYAVLFFLVVAVGYIPGLKDSQGRLCGLFMIEWWDDALHIVSGVWAGVAALRSYRAALLYFQTFGILYFLDGVVGFFLGQGYLDLGIIRFGPAQYDLATKIGANIPHLVIGGLAIWIGFVLSKRLEKRAAERAAATSSASYAA